MLFVAGNPNELSQPRIFIEAMKGVAQIVDCFLSVGDDRTYTVRMPSVGQLGYEPPLILALAFMGKLRQLE